MPVNSFCQRKIRRMIWETNQAREDIFYIGIRTASALPSQVIEPGNAVHKEINNGDDDGDSDWVAPDHKGGDDTGAPVIFEIGAVARGSFVTRAWEPAENTEESGYHVYTKDCSNSAQRNTKRISNLISRYALQFQGNGTHSCQDGQVWPPRVTNISQFSVSEICKNKISWGLPKFWMKPPFGRNSEARITQVAMASRAPKVTEIIQILGNCHSTGRASKCALS